MLVRQDNNIYIWRKEGNDAVIIRAFGGIPHARIPEFIEGHRVVGIESYCFADKEKIPKELECDMTEAMTEKSMRPLCGDYIESVTLPETVVKVGNCAFYGCRDLKTIECGSELNEIGSDAFLNCTQLRNIIIDGDVHNRTGVRGILSQLSSNVEVCFENKNETSAVIFFPEYYEGYDEIGPAHIFGLNIEGEGFRARQCFKNGIFDPVQYDGIFQKASTEESEKTLSRMALGRLRYPTGLQEQYKLTYSNYIMDNGESVIRRLIDNKNLDAIGFLCKSKLLIQNDVENAITYAAERSWAEGAASLMSLKNLYYGKASKKSYDFDSF